MKILQELIIPHESVNDDKVVVLNLCFQNGDAVRKGDVLLEFETSKAALSLEALEGGFIYFNCEEGDEVDVGSVVARILESALTESMETRQAEIPKNKLVADDAIPVRKTIFSKKAEELLQEKGLKESDFAEKDFVNSDDITGSKGNRENKVTGEGPEKRKIAALKIPHENVEIEKIPIQKKREIEYLSAVQSSGLNSSVSVFIEAEKVLEVVNDMPLLKNSFLPIIIYEASRLLKKYPKMNSYFQDNSIVYYKDVNLGIAMDMDKGLRVLKIPGPNKLSILEIEKAIIDLSRKYFEDKSSLDDLSDITFTLTDLSGAGIDSFLPLINRNNSAILAISSMDERFKRLNLSVTFDHRVTEGKYAAGFLSDLKAKIESYFKTEVSEDTTGGHDIRCYKCMRKLDDQITFLKVIDSKGNDQVLCHVCYEGH